METGETSVSIEGCREATSGVSQGTRAEIDGHGGRRLEARGSIGRGAECFQWDLHGVALGEGFVALREPESFFGVRVVRDHDRVLGDILQG
jgi:hypothetical protein